MSQANCCTASGPKGIEEKIAETGSLPVLKPGDWKAASIEPRPTASSSSSEGTSALGSYQRMRNWPSVIASTSSVTLKPQLPIRTLLCGKALATRQLMRSCALAAPTASTPARTADAQVRDTLKVVAASLLKRLVDSQPDPRRAATRTS